MKPYPWGSLGKRARRSVRKDAEARRRRTAATAAGLPSKRGPSAADPAWNRQRANLCVSASPRESFLIFPPLFVPLRANTFRLGFRLAARGGELGAGELARRIGIGPREFLAGGDRPFLEAQPAVMVGIELRIGLAQIRKQFVEIGRAHV